MADGQVVFEISADGRKAMASIDQITDAMKKSGVKWEQDAKNATDNVGSSFSSMVKKIVGALAAAKIGQMLKGIAADAIQAASNLEEVQNVVDVTFGESSREIDAWAKNAITQYGLTETKAKQFASTMGAMMKSSGLAGKEIVGMSEDLAGLAADMASFYNMDFDTAFQKIRSGISGETEPLKQLGINMSVANLEAFAMTQGITKAFDKMSQSEQIMLRYQYLMQATADAQGDFARTSDGYANGLRLLEANLDSLKTTLGSFLIGPADRAIGWLNDFLGALTQPRPRTVLDEFADIEADTNKRIAEIGAKATEAEAMVAALEKIAGKEMAATGLTEFVETLQTQFGNLESAINSAKEGDYAGTITAVAGALSSKLDGDPKEWETLLTAIGEKMPAVNSAAAAGGGTPDFLSDAAEAANELGGQYPAYWQSLVNALGSDKAKAMVEAFAEGAAGAAALEAFATGANTLKSGSDKIWGDLLNALQNHGALNGIFGSPNIPNNITGLADALSTDVPEEKAQAWMSLLGTLSENAGALTGLTGQDAAGTKAWLEELAAGAQALDPADAQGWETLFDSLVKGLPGLEDSEEGRTFLDTLKKVGGEFDNYGAYLQAMGVETNNITDTQKAWLEIVKRLMQTIPGLSDIINEETGEVKGGSAALKQYVKDWAEYQQKTALMDAFERKKQALNEYMAGLYDYEVTYIVAKQKYENAYKKAYEDAVAQGLPYPAVIAEKVALNYRVQMGVAEAEYTRQAEAIEEAKLEAEAFDDAMKALAEDMGNSTFQTKASTSAVEGWSEETQKAAAEVYNALADATTELADYMETVRGETARQVEQTVNGFSRLQTASERWADAQNELNDLKEAFAKATPDEQGEYEIKIKGAQEALATVNNMNEGLRSQIAYMEEYLQNLSTARERGVSASLISDLSDGSQESALYLHAIATATDAELETLDDLYSQVNELRGSFTDTLTENKLAVDDDFQALLDKTNDLIAQLNQYDEAKSQIGQTVQGIADGIAAHIPDVELQVDKLNSALSRLNSLSGIGGLGFGGGLIRLGAGVSNFLIGSHETGLDYVPFDNYLAQLHEGESVLTAEEARVWRQFRYGAQSTANAIDYGAMGSAMWEHAPNMGGNVYLDGQTVGRIMSARQADAYRSLERSGWRG